ncbi:MAG: DUF302 domain-containing protein [Candidatus Sedimenticola sp. (ex Thyasira tokunagai)]
MYEFNLTLNQPFDQAMEQVRKVLMENQLGIVSDVDVQATFKTKMDKDIPAYHILGACNPKLADRVLTAEPNAGVLLPCNLILREQSADETVVSFMDPQAVLGLSGSAEVKEVADEAREKLLRVVEQLQNA